MKKTSKKMSKKQRLRKRRIRLAIILLAFASIVALIVFCIVSCANKPKTESAGEMSAQQTQQPDVEQIPDDPQPQQKTDTDEPLAEKPQNSGTEEPDKTTSDASSSSSSSSQGPDHTQSAPEPTPEPADEILPIGQISRSAWNLVLANPDSPLPDGFQRTLSLSSFSSDYKVDSRMLPYLKKMFAAAKSDGITLVLRSAFRTNARQWELYNGRVQEYIDKGYSKEEAAKIAATINAYPGTSEHETGLAVDILSNNYTRFNEGFDQTKEYAWLEKNAHIYGFILRYPKDKTGIHKIIYEPWHYRWVGVENSYPIYEKGICLEEYLQTIN